MTKAKAKKGGDLGNDIYDGAAAFGRFVALVSTIIGGLIGFVLIVIGLVFVIRPGANMQPIMAKVTSANCVTTSGSGTSCSLGVEYTVDNKKQSGTIQTTSGVYNVGQTIEILYDPSNPSYISQKQMSRRTIGAIMIAFGAFIILLCGLYYYMVLRFKFLAAAAGVTTATSMVAEGISQVINETD